MTAIRLYQSSDHSEYYGNQSSVSNGLAEYRHPLTVPALFAVESGAPVKQIQPHLIQGNARMKLYCPLTILIHYSSMSGSNQSLPLP